MTVSDFDLRHKIPPVHLVHLSVLWLPASSSSSVDSPNLADSSARGICNICSVGESTRAHLCGHVRALVEDAGTTGATYGRGIGPLISRKPSTIDRNGRV